LFLDKDGMEPNMRIQEAIRKFAAIGDDFHKIFMWHILHGFVVARPDALLLAYHCKSSNVDEPTEEQGSDCIFITYYGGSLPKFLSALSDWDELVSFQRAFKLKTQNKTYSAKRMKQIVKSLIK